MRHASLWYFFTPIVICAPAFFSWYLPEYLCIWLPLWFKIYCLRIPNWDASLTVFSKTCVKAQKQFKNQTTLSVDFGFSPPQKQGIKISGLGARLDIFWGGHPILTSYRIGTRICHCILPDKVLKVCTVFWKIDAAHSWEKWFTFFPLLCWVLFICF